jgi:mannose-6-phosphate isomerase-like protein (cupin superfamily)
MDMKLESEFAAVTEHWSPRVVAEANGQYFKIAKVEGELVWHAHAAEDEFFLVRKGIFGLRFRTGPDVILHEGDFYVVPKGVEHLPFSIGGEAWIMFVEPAATKHTGETITGRSKSIDSQREHLR